MMLLIDWYVLHECQYIGGSSAGNVLQSLRRIVGKLDTDALRRIFTPTDHCSITRFSGSHSQLMTICYVSVECLLLFFLFIFYGGLCFSLCLFVWLLRKQDYIKSNERICMKLPSIHWFQPNVIAQSVCEGRNKDMPLQRKHHWLQSRCLNCLFGYFMKSINIIYLEMGIEAAIIHWEQRTESKYSWRSFVVTEKSPSTLKVLL